jgi:uncharacterized protein YjbJ (UPF0337 family)
MRNMVRSPRCEQGAIETRNISRSFLFSINYKQGRTTMDWNRVEGNWKEMKGKVKEKWGKLTDDDITAINGRRDQLEGALQCQRPSPSRC